MFTLTGFAINFSMYLIVRLFSYNNNLVIANANSSWHQLASTNPVVIV